MLEQINLTARGQTLTGNCIKVASDVVNLIPFHVDLGEDWNYSSIKAVFCNTARNTAREVVLDHNGNGLVPPEVLTDKGKVEVNLYAGRYDGEEFLIERLPSYKTVVIEIPQKVRVGAENSIPPTPETWEQDVARLDSRIDDVENEIPTELSELESDTTHRTVTDTEKEAWNAKSEFSGSYNDLTDVPSTFPPSEHNHDSRYYTQEEVDALLSQPLYPRG